jgi:hypothetical protein
MPGGGCQPVTESPLALGYSRGNSSMVVPNATAQPRGMRALVDQGRGRHRIKFGGQHHRVGAGDSKYQERAGIAEHCRAHRRRKLVDVLIPKTKVRGKLARLGEQRRDASVPKL